jgi:hypothetical protein
MTCSSNYGDGEKRLKESSALTEIAGKPFPTLSNLILSVIGSSGGESFQHIRSKTTCAGRARPSSDLLYRGSFTAVTYESCVARQAKAVA